MSLTRTMTMFDYLGQTTVYQAPHDGTPAVEVRTMSMDERRAAQAWMKTNADWIKVALLTETASGGARRALTLLGEPAHLLVQRSPLYKALSGP